MSEPRNHINERLHTGLAQSGRAAGYKCVGKCGGLRWTGKRRPEVDLCPAQYKLRFERSEQR